MKRAYEMKDWKEYFLPAILSRGQKYYLEDRIRDIQQYNGVIRAKVSGTKEYAIEIDPDAPNGNNWYCDCPYAKNGENCKHMAAVLFALEEGKISYKSVSPVKVQAINHTPYELPWKEAIDQLSETLVRKELMRLADQSDSLRERLTILHHNGLPDGLLYEWRAEAYLITDDYADHRGYIDRYQSDEFSMELCNFMEAKLSLLIKIKASADAFALVQMIGEAAKRRPLYETEQSEMTYIAEQCKQSINEIEPIADDVLKERMWQWHNNFFQCKRLEGNWHHYKIEFIDPKNPDIPYYRLTETNDEWKEAPVSARGLYYDPIEDDLEFDKIKKIVLRKAQAKIGDRYRGFGTCHLLWYNMEEIFRSEYGIDWHSPAKMNPRCYFD